MRRSRRDGRAETRRWRGIAIPATLLLGLAGLTAAEEPPVPPGSADPRSHEVPLPAPRVLWPADTVGFALAAHHDPAYDSTLTRRGKARPGSIAVPADPAALRPQIPADGAPHRWLLVATFDRPIEARREIKAAVFGWNAEQDSALEVLDSGPWDEDRREPFELANPGWPGAGSGVGVAWGPGSDDSVATRAVVPLYWFVTTSEKACSIRFGPHPTQGLAVLFRGSLHQVSHHSTPRLGIGVPGENPVFATIVLPEGVLTRAEQLECDPESAGRRPARSVAAGTASARVRYAFGWDRDDLTLSETLDGGGTFACLFAVLEGDDRMGPFEDPRRVEIFSNLPCELTGPSGLPDRISAPPVRRALPGGLAGTAVARWDLRLDAEPDTTWTLRIAIADAADSLDAAYRESGLRHRYVVMPPGRHRRDPPVR